MTHFTKQSAFRKRSIFGFFYDLLLHLYLIASLPKVFFQWGRYKKVFLKRLGKDFPLIEKCGRKLIWIHAVSLGETKAVAPLIKKLKSLQKPPLVVLSAITATGYHEGLENIPEADFHVFLPLDISYLIRPIVRKVSPDVVILTETDFWFHFQDAAKQEKAKLFLVNGKISERSFQRLSKLPFLAKRLLNSLDHLFLQGEIYRSRFERLKIPPSKLTVTGNIKLDREIELADIAHLKHRLGLGDEPILTLGSTHNPEERLWIKALQELWNEFPQLKVFLAPRHPERFSSVAHLLNTHKIPFSRWSEGGSMINNRLLLVDTIGVLNTCYQLSTLAFVGGSFTPKVGGHNILEPAFYGKPVLFGPHMHTQPDLLDLMNSFQAGIQLKPETMIATLKNLLTHPSLCQKLGSNGVAMTNSARGSLENTFRLLQKHLAC